MRLLFPLILLMASCTGACATSPVSEPPAFSDPMTEGQYLATVRIIVTCDEGTVFGTGVAVSPTDIITARHVVLACDVLHMTAITLHGQVEVVLQSISVTADAARLRAVDGRFPRYARPHYPAVPIGAEVCSVGGDVHVQLMRKCGEVFQLAEGVVLTSIQAVPGNSGGPVFYHERVAGIVSMGSWNPSSEKVQLYVPVSAFSDLLGGL